MGTFFTIGTYFAVLLAVIQFPSFTPLWGSILTGATQAREDFRSEFPKGGRVVHVVDGDTLWVGKTKVRLLGVNTPEMEWKTHGKKTECFGPQAKDFLKMQTLGKNVRLEGDPLADPKDKYGRTLAWVYVDNRLINLEIIRLGFGFAMRNFPNSKKSEMIRAEQNAKQRRQGVWSHCSVDCARGYCRVD